MNPSIAIRGKITECDASLPPICQRVVYQQVAPSKGNLIGNGTWNWQRRAWVKPPDPRTPPQIARRAMFRAAVAAWQALPPAARDQWRAAAAGKPISGYNLFISAYLE